MTHQIMEDKDPTIPGPSTKLNYACNHELYWSMNHNGSKTLYMDMTLLYHNIAW